MADVAGIAMSAAAADRAASVRAASRIVGVFGSRSSRRLNCVGADWLTLRSGRGSRPSLGVTEQRTASPRRRSSLAQHVRQRCALHRAHELAVDGPAVPIAHDVVVGILRDERRRDAALDDVPRRRARRREVRPRSAFGGRFLTCGCFAPRRRSACRRASSRRDRRRSASGPTAPSETRCAKASSRGRAPSGESSSTRQPIDPFGRRNRIRRSPTPGRRHRTDLDAGVDDLRAADERPGAHGPVVREVTLPGHRLRAQREVPHVRLGRDRHLVRPPARALVARPGERLVDLARDLRREVEVRPGRVAARRRPAELLPGDDRGRCASA